MAKKIKPTTLPFGKFLVRIYDPTLEKWSQPCGFTSKGLQRTKSVQESVVPYCDDPDAVAETERKADAKSSTFSGSGKAALEDHDMWERFYEDDESWLVRIEMSVPRGKGGGYYEGNFVFTDGTLSVDRGQTLNIEVTLQSDGAVPWVAAAA